MTTDYTMHGGEPAQLSEDNLQTANQLLEHIFNSINVLVAYIDRDFNFIRVNDHYARVGGHPVSFFTGKNHFDLYPNEDNKAIFNRVVQTGEPYQVYAKPFVYAEYPERGVTYWDWNLQPVCDETGKVYGLVFTLLDVTERILAQQALAEANARLAELNKDLEARVAARTNDLMESNKLLEQANFDLAYELAERERVEQELNKSEAKFSSIYEANIMPLAFWHADGRITEANDAYLKLTGYTRHELETGAIRWIDITDPEQLYLDRKAFEESKAGETIAPYEKDYCLRDGRRIPVLIGGGLLPGSREEGIAFAVDLSEQKRIQAEHDRHIANLDNLLEVSKQVMAETSAEKLLQRIADAAVAFTEGSIGLVWYGYKGSGFRSGAASSRPGVTLSRPGDFFTIDKGGVYVEIIEHGKTLRLTQQQLLAHPAWWGLLEGHIELNGLLGAPLLSVDGQSQGLVMVSGKLKGEFNEEDEALLEQLAAIGSLALQQIEARHSAERRADELAAVNRELQEFTFVAAHDLQEPLRKLQIFSELLITQHCNQLDPTGLDFLQRANRSAARMQSLVRDLQAFSNITMKPLSYVSLNLNNLVKQILADMENQIQEAGAKIEVEPLPNLEADPEQVKLLLSHLFRNAILFRNPQVPLVVKVSARRLPTSGYADEQVEICIEDNGIGIRPEYLGRLFQPFQRIQRPGPEEGSGIGLTLCRKIVQRHSGTITARSLPGQGSTFVITLPVRQLSRTAN